MLLKSWEEVEALPPRQLPLWQYWMSQHHDIINTEYSQQFPDKDHHTHAKDISTHCRIACELWEKLAEEERESLCAEMVVQWKKDVADYYLVWESMVGSVTVTEKSQLR